MKFEKAEMRAEKRHFNVWLFLEAKLREIPKKFRSLTCDYVRLERNPSLIPHLVDKYDTIFISANT